MRRLATGKWLVTHALVIGVVVLFVALGWWQLHRAEAGNTRSYGYALEWPSMAVLAIGFWVKIIRDELRPGRPGDHAAGPAAPSDPTAAAPARPDAAHAELDAYNRHIADLARRRQRG
jgi:DNA-binding transcriptional regulator of glucitol operon